MRRDARLTFVRQFSTDEIVEIGEMYDVLHEMVYNELCPSNAMIQKHYNQGFPGKDILYFGSYETYPLHAWEDGPRGAASKLPRDMVYEAWGSYETQFVKVQDIMKLRPDQLLYLRNQLHCKAERLAYLNNMPEMFHRRPASLRDALEAVMAERHMTLPIHYGVDGGILDYQNEAPNGRYKSHKHEEEWYNVDEVEPVGDSEYEE